MVWRRTNKTQIRMGRSTSQQIRMLGGGKYRLQNPKHTRMENQIKPPKTIQAGYTLHRTEKQRKKTNNISERQQQQLDNTKKKTQANAKVFLVEKRASAESLCNRTKATCRGSSYEAAAPPSCPSVARRPTSSRTTVQSPTPVPTAVSSPISRATWMVRYITNSKDFTSRKRATRS